MQTTKPVFISDNIELSNFKRELMKLLNHDVNDIRSLLTESQTAVMLCKDKSVLIFETKATIYNLITYHVTHVMTFRNYTAIVDYSLEIGQTVNSSVERIIIRRLTRSNKYIELCKVFQLDDIFICQNRQTDKARLSSILSKKLKVKQLYHHLVRGGKYER